MTSVPPSSRLTYIDWMRGVACLLMFQIHGYDAWLSPDARTTAFFAWARVFGGFAAPAFLFLAGVSVAFVTDKLQSRGHRPSEIAAITIRRGAVILGLGLLLRLQGFVFSLGGAPWEDVFRVDILNIIGLSMILMGLMCGVVPAQPLMKTGRPESFRVRLAVVSAAIGMALSMLAPPLWTTWRPRWLPWPIESYINGVHNLNQPQSWLFPIFPWGAFAFAGMAAGLIFTLDAAKRRQARTILLAAAAGGAIVLVARYLDANGPAIYSVYDFWRTSPNYFLIRLGILLMFLPAAYWWCRWIVGSRQSSPLVLLGRHSMLVYWVHLIFVYGALPIVPRGTATVAHASYGVIAVSIGMYVLALAWSRWETVRGHRTVGAGL